MDTAPTEATAEEKAEAEKLKNEGNQLMRDEKFTEAVDCYTKWVFLAVLIGKFVSQAHFGSTVYPIFFFFSPFMEPLS